MKFDPQWIIDLRTADLARKALNAWIEAILPIWTIEAIDKLGLDRKDDSDLLNKAIEAGLKGKDRAVEFLERGNPTADRLFYNSVCTFGINHIRDLLLREAEVNDWSINSRHCKLNSGFIQTSEGFDSDWAPALRRGYTSHDRIIEWASQKVDFRARRNVLKRTGNTENERLYNVAWDVGMTKFRNLLNETMHSSEPDLDDFESKWYSHLDYQMFVEMDMTIFGISENKAKDWSKIRRHLSKSDEGACLGKLTDDDFEKIAEATNLSKKQVEDLISLVRRCNSYNIISLDNPLGDDTDSTVEDILPNKSVDDPASVINNDGDQVLRFCIREILDRPNTIKGCRAKLSELYFLFYENDDWTCKKLIDEFFVGKHSEDVEVHRRVEQSLRQRLKRASDELDQKLPALLEKYGWSVEELRAYFDRRYHHGEEVN